MMAWDFWAEALDDGRDFGGFVIKRRRKLRCPLRTKKKHHGSKWWVLLLYKWQKGHFFRENANFGNVKINKTKNSGRFTCRCCGWFRCGCFEFWPRLPFTNGAKVETTDDDDLTHNTAKNEMNLLHILILAQFCSRAEKKSISKKNKCLENFF